MSSTESKRRVQSQLHVTIREAMTARNWSSTQLADILGVKLGVVSRWLTLVECKRVVPLPQTCVQIAEVFDLDAVEVFRLAGYLPLVDEVPTYPSHPHEQEIRVLKRRYTRILESIPEDAWSAAYAVARAHLDGLPLLLNAVEPD